MSPFEIGLYSLGGIVILVYLGFWVPFALMLSSYIGVWLIKDSSVLAGKLLALAASETISSYFFGVVPLFVFMGNVVSATGMGEDAYDVANQAFRKIRGGLAIGTVGANAVFAAITGISIASAAVFTKIAVPHMIKFGYSPRFSVGVVAGSSVLGMLIPPSLLLILYGILTEQSIGDLFIAAIIPGILLAIVFGLGILLLSFFWPSFVHSKKNEQEELGLQLMNLKEFLQKAGPLVILIFVVLGGIYGGFFTPIEAGAIGSLGAVLIGLIKRRLSLTTLWEVLVETGYITAAISFLIIAAQMYARMLALSGMPSEFGSFVVSSEFSIMSMILLYILLVILMGTILDSGSIMLILVPLMYPILVSLNIDLIWFGIVTVIAVEVGLLTPPLGISVFVIKSSLDDKSITLGDIFVGAFPFAIMMIAVLFLVIAFPQLTTFLL
ncbi:MAG: TRAP transporter large permease [Paracoccaceae bacterium]